MQAPAVFQQGAVQIDQQRRVLGTKPPDRHRVPVTAGDERDIVGRLRMRLLVSQEVVRGRGSLPGVDSEHEGKHRDYPLHAPIRSAAT
jgi:hypothetical protein